MYCYGKRPFITWRGCAVDSPMFYSCALGVSVSSTGNALFDMRTLGFAPNSIFSCCDHTAQFF